MPECENLIEDAAEALLDVRIERAAVTHHFEQEFHHATWLFRSSDSREVHYVLQNWGFQGHRVVPIRAEKEVDHRFSKKVVDRAGKDLVFLDESLSWAAMEQALEVVVGETWDFVNRKSPPKDMLKGLAEGFAALGAGKELPAKSWARFQQQFSALADSLIAMQLANDDEEGLKAILFQRMAQADQLVEEANAGRYIPLVLLEEPLVPEFEKVDGAGKWRQFIAHVEPALFDHDPGDEPERDKWRRVSWYLKRNLLNGKFVRDASWFTHRQMVEVPLPSAVEEVHVRIVMPEDMVGQGPDWERYGIRFRKVDGIYVPDVVRVRRSVPAMTVEVPLLKPLPKNCSQSSSDLRFVLPLVQIKEWQEMLAKSIAGIRRELRQDARPQDAANLEHSFPAHQFSRTRVVARFREPFYYWLISASAIIGLPVVVAMLIYGLTTFKDVPTIGYLGLVGAAWLRGGESQRHFIMVRLAAGACVALAGLALHVAGGLRLLPFYK